MKAGRVRLGECIKIVSGYPFEAARFNESRDGLPVARIRDVVRGHSETHYSGTYPENSKIENGDLLVRMDGEFNIAPWRGGVALFCNAFGVHTAEPNDIIEFNGQALRSSALPPRLARR